MMKTLLVLVQLIINMPALLTLKSLKLYFFLKSCKLLILCSNVSFEMYLFNLVEKCEGCEIFSSNFQNFRAVAKSKWLTKRE